MLRVHHGLTLALLGCSAASDDPLQSASTGSTGTSEASPEPSTGPPPSLSTTSVDPTTGEPPAETSGSSTRAESGESSESSESSGLPSPLCGDGEIQPGEECDLGHGTNADDAMCTLSCTLAQCGDGLVWAGVEACDAGEDHSETQYDGCTKSCERGPHCGDGVVQEVEQCDMGPANGSGMQPIDGVPCKMSCFYDAALVFLSSEVYSPPELGGFFGANQRCKELAAAAGLHAPETFRAWLSFKNAGPRDHFPKAIPGKPYALVTGHRVADDRAQLLATGPLTAIAVTETKQTVYDEQVWTNVEPDGTVADPGLDCDEWSTDDPMFEGHVGHSGFDKADDPVAWQTWKAEGFWTSAVNFDCYYKYRIYCFEEHDPELP